LNYPKTLGKTGHAHGSYIDDHNNEFFCNTLADGFSDGDSMEDILTALNKRSGRYARILTSHEKYSPQSTLRMNPFNVMQQEGLLPLAMKIAKDYEKLNPTSREAKTAKRRIKDLMHKAYERKAIRRGCKYGIQMVAMELNVDLPAAKLHFLLDEVDMQDVIKKTPVDHAELADGTPYKYVYVTATELRSAFRYWNVLNQKKVFFYLNGEEVGPPWRNAWKDKIDCHNIKRTNNPSWWTTLVDQDKAYHGPTFSRRDGPQRSGSRQQGSRISKYQKIREKFEKGNVK
jgi:hypothetical protein